MKDLTINRIGKGMIEIIPNTKEAKDIFIECGLEKGQHLEGKEKSLKSLLSWINSNRLSFDSSFEITIEVQKIPELDKEGLKKVFPGVPDSFLPKKLFAVGYSKFKGDSFDKLEKTKSWSVNDKFNKGDKYPVYDHEGLFVVGIDGKGYKMTPKAWTQIKAY